jgi:hypothetical protein
MGVRLSGGPREDRWQADPDLPALSAGHQQLRVVFVHRDLDEVLASQAKMLERRAEDPGDDDGRMKLLYAEHLSEAARELAARSCFETLDLRHRETIQDPEGAAARINAFLGSGLDEQAMAEVVDPDLYRNRA